MLKKAGIVVATAAAGLLAVSPLAFAGDYSSDNDHHHHSSDHHHRHGGNCFQDTSANERGGRRDDGGALLDVSRNVVQVPIQACNNNVVNNVIVGILAKNQRAQSDNG